MSEGATGTSVITETETEARSGYCPMWKVIMHNDDKTTMQFVIDILVTIFNKEHLAAFELMMQIHEQGYGIAGVYPKEHAELRIEQAVSLARARQFPLTLTLEKA